MNSRRVTIATYDRTVEAAVAKMYLVLCHSQNLACGKGDRRQLCEAPVGPFRQLTPDPFTTPIPKLNGDKALEAGGISVFMINEPMVGLDWLSSVSPGEIQLQVAEDDVPQAVAQLVELARNRQPAGSVTDEEVCLSCGSPMNLAGDCCTKCGWTYL
jgi:hypothetical protein